jgi:hypothetical protein
LTHTLHRLGARESLEEDYVILVMSAKGVNDKGSSDKLRKALTLAMKFDPVNVGDMKTGSMYSKGIDMQRILDGVKDTSIVHGVFSSFENASKYLKALKAENLGLSVVISGLFDKILEMTQQNGLAPHTINLSLGRFGRTDLLPEVLPVTTMCGHHQVSPRLVRKLANQVRNGLMSTEQAGKELSSLCVCGVFNPVRAAEYIELLAEGASLPIEDKVERF